MDVSGVTYANGAANGRYVEDPSLVHIYTPSGGCVPGVPIYRQQGGEGLYLWLYRTGRWYGSVTLGSSATKWFHTDASPISPDLVLPGKWGDASNIITPSIEVRGGKYAAHKVNISCYL